MPKKRIRKLLTFSFLVFTFLALVLTSLAEVSVESVTNIRSETNELYPRPIDGVFVLQDVIGKMYVRFDDRASQLTAYFDNHPPVSLDYPPSYPGGVLTARNLAYAAQIGTLFVCQSNQLFQINLEEKEFDALNHNICRNSDRLSLSPDRRYLTDETGFHVMDVQTGAVGFMEDSPVESWLETVSPSWTYKLEIDATVGEEQVNCASMRATDDIYRTAVRVKERYSGEVTTLFCANWTHINILDWVDDDHVVLLGTNEVDGDILIEEVYSVDLSSRSVINLGPQIRRSERVFMNGQRIAQVYARDYPISCSLRIVNTLTAQAEFSESTNCNQPSDITLVEAMHTLYYLWANSLTDPDSLIPQLRRVDLSSPQSSDIELSGIQVIDDVSSSGRYLSLIADANRQGIRNLYHIAEFNDPRILVVDTRNNTIVYTYSADSTFVETSWSQAVDAVLISPGTDEPGYSLVNFEPPFQQFDFPEGRNAVWSPDGKMVLLYSPSGVLIHDLTTHETSEILELARYGDQVVNVDWYDNDSILVELWPRKSSENEVNLTSQRWIVEVR